MALTPCDSVSSVPSLTPNYNSFFTLHTSLSLLSSLFPWLLLFLFSPSHSPSLSSYAFSSPTTVPSTRRSTTLASTSCPTPWTGRPQCHSTMILTKTRKKMSRVVLAGDHYSGVEWSTTSPTVLFLLTESRVLLVLEDLTTLTTATRRVDPSIPTPEAALSSRAAGDDFGSHHTRLRSQIKTAL